jgi:hypothetical protein
MIFRMTILSLALGSCASQRVPNRSLLEFSAPVVQVPLASLILDERAEQSGNTYYSVSTANGRAFLCAQR